ncbi:MAG: hypothetical protein AB7I08_15190 [Thermoleophilia bacterium]
MDGVVVVQAKLGETLNVDVRGVGGRSQQIDVVASARDDPRLSEQPPGG